MAHVLQHVHTCIYYTQYLAQFSPYIIINYTKILYTITLLPFISRYYQMLLYPKPGKKYIFSCLLYGVFYHIKLPSLLIYGKAKMLTYI